MRVRRPSVRTIAVAVVVLALAGPSAWIALSHDAFAVGDIALIELRTRDVFSAHPPLVGAYSRYGWSHPGPFEFYLFAIPYRLFGSDFAALRLTALVFSAVVIAAVAWVARRRGAAALAILLASATCLVWGLSAATMVDSWNVTIAVLPFLLTVVACWCAWCGDRWAWLVAAVAFSFVFQAHVGFGVVLLPLVLVTLVRLCIQAGREGTSLGWRGVATGAAAGLALAVPVLVDVVAHWPGNLERLIKWSVSSDEPTIGMSQGLRLVGRSSSLSFPFHARFPNQFVFSIEAVDVGFLPGALLLLLGTALILTVKRRMFAEAWLCTCLAITWSSGLIAASRVTRPLAFWLVEWLQPLAWLTWGAVALVAWRLLRPAVEGRFSRIRVLPVATAAAIGVLAAGTVAYAHGTSSAGAGSTTVAPIKAFVAATTDHVDRSQPVHISYGGDPFAAGTVFLAVANQLDRAGFTLCVDAAYANQFGDARVCAGRSDLGLFIRDEATVLDPPDNATTLAVVDPLSSTQRAEADALTSRLAEVLAQNDLSSDEPLLFTALVEKILDDLPRAAAAANRTDVIRLGELRKVPGTRLGLYAIGP